MKKLLVAAAILLAIIAGGIYWAHEKVDVIVKVAVEQYGPDVVGASVKLDEVRISATTGAGSVKGLEIGSPRGFSAARTARFGEIRISVDPLTLTDPVVVLREVTIESPVIAFERGREGSNLDAIQRNIDAYVKRAESEPSATGKPPRRFIVERLAIRGAKVTMTTPELKGQGITFDLPEIALSDIGKRENGLRASQVASIVAGALISRIAQKVLTNFDLLRKGGVQGAVDAVKGLIK